MVEHRCVSNKSRNVFSLPYVPTMLWLAVRYRGLPCEETLSSQEKERTEEEQLFDLC